MSEETVSNGARGDHTTGTNLNEFVSFLTLLIGCFCSGTNTQSRFDPKPKANCPILLHLHTKSRLLRLFLYLIIQHTSQL